ncbi:hypothetical protein [Nonomuraea basaltis]|uniref:hypothetical protein n=1 Tax=Nonomuraea basaltis TaxID=2495887 RepID=UPI00198034A4|nr:hypothetical protein [Nonomuraea basaltis]
MSGWAGDLLDGGALQEGRRGGASVEDDERALFQIEVVEVAVELRQSVGDGIGLAGVADLELDRLPLPNAARSMRMAASARWASTRSTTSW